MTRRMDTPAQIRHVRPGRLPRSAKPLLIALLVLVGCEPAGRGEDRATADTATDSYVGVRYHVSSPPAGVVDEGGMMVESADEHEYGVGFRRTTDGRQTLWLQRLTGRDAQGRPSWEVLAVLELPALGDDEHMIPIGCELPDDADTPVVAIGRYPDYDEVTTPRAAWRVDVARAAFVPVDAARVVCRSVA
jgi:hypothetical protein